MVNDPANKSIVVPIQRDTLDLDSVQEHVGILPTAKSSFSGRPDQFVLPGQGKPYPDCGEPVIYLCPRCGHLKKNEGEGKNCRRATCPKCYHTWAWLLAKKAANRILHATKVAARQLGRARRPIHVVISLPKSAWILFQDDYPSARRQAYKLLIKAGMLGGLLIAHPWRQKCVLCEGDIVGSWRVDEETKQFHQKERYCEDCGSRQFKWIPGPHFHFIGYGWTEHTKSIELATGYLIKNIGLLNNVGGAVWYQLTHCGVRAGRQVITYFGVCALRNYKSPKLPRDTKPELCPNCGALMVKTTIAQLSGRPPPWDPQSQNSRS